MADEDTGPILITGGTGFIGSYLAMRLLEKKGNEHEQVLLFDCNPDVRRLTGFKERYQKVSNRITFVQGDLSSLELVLALFEHKPKSVFHLGALLSAGADANPTLGFQVDTLGTRHVLEAARIYGQRQNMDPVKVVFPSTIASFGLFIAAGQKVKNEDIQVPTTMYGVSKVTSERLGEYYQRKGDFSKSWVDFRAVRFPSVVGAARGPGGTTVYSTLMIQQPAQNKPYEAYVAQDTRLDIIYVEDAVSALIQLHDAPKESLKRRVYNIAGIRNADGQAPQASDIEAAVREQKPDASITYKVNQQLSDTVRSFGVLDDSVAREDWGWTGESFGLQKAVRAFFDDVKNYPDRIKAIELY
ncbi:threonine 3-dehydrogenase [Bradyrhizobium diazoefficiens]|uniref:NAD-dependent epimerase/dehydratase family protein n=1 Tax=Bradyrhizobium diazoefficiens TaxID=1355477 RepID=UPI003513CE8E